MNSAEKGCKMKREKDNSWQNNEIKDSNEKWKKV